RSRANAGHASATITRNNPTDRTGPRIGPFRIRNEAGRLQRQAAQHPDYRLTLSCQTQSPRTYSSAVKPEALTIGPQRSRSAWSVAPKAAGPGQPRHVVLRRARRRARRTPPPSPSPMEILRTRGRPARFTVRLRPRSFSTSECLGGIAGGIDARGTFAVAFFT